MATKKTISYEDLNRELETVINSLQSGELSIDEALQAYSRGQEIIAQLQDFLKTASNTVKKITS